MIIEFKKGDSTEGWIIGNKIRKAIKDLELDEIVKADKQPFGDIPVLKQVAKKDFVIEIKPN